MKATGVVIGGPCEGMVVDFEMGHETVEVVEPMQVGPAVRLGDPIEDLRMRSFIYYPKEITFGTRAHPDDRGWVLVEVGLRDASDFIAQVTQRLHLLAITHTKARGGDPGRGLGAGVMSEHALYYRCRRCGTTYTDGIGDTEAAIRDIFGVLQTDQIHGAGEDYFRRYEDHACLDGCHGLADLIGYGPPGRHYASGGGGS